MKDVISILQSRVAKRENVIALFEQARNYNNFFRHLIEQQKQDKRILAEIVQLRRQGRKYRHAKAVLTSINYFQEMSEQEVLEMENKILVARWGV